LAAAVLTSVWRVQDLFPALAPFKLPSLMLLALLGLMVVSPREQARVALVGRSFVMRGVFAIVVMAALSVPTSLWMGHSFAFLLKNLLPAVVLALAAAAAIYTVADARRVAAIQLGGAVLYAIVILTTFEIGDGGRLGNLVYYDANDLGMLMVCVLPLALYFIGDTTRPLVRILGVTMAGLFLLTIVKTGSRGAFVALIAMTLYLLLRYSTVHWARRVALLGGVAAIFVASTGAQYWTAMGTLLEPKADYNWIGNTDAGRMDLWGRGIDYMLDRPLTGVGLAAFPIAEGTISPIASRQMFGRGVKWGAAHSAYVQIGAELGVLALLAFLGILGSALLTCGRLARDAQQRGERSVVALARAQGASLVGFMVAAVFLSQAYAPFLFISFGTIIGLDLAARQSWRRTALA
jgi:O-antigen ligase